MHSRNPFVPFEENVALYRDALKKIFPVHDNFLMWKIHLMIGDLAKLRWANHHRTPVRVYLDIPFPGSPLSGHAGILVWTDCHRALIMKRARAAIRYSYSELEALAFNCLIHFESLPYGFPIPAALAPFVPQDSQNRFIMPEMWLRKKGKVIRKRFTRALSAPRQWRCEG